MEPKHNNYSAETELPQPEEAVSQPLSEKTSAVAPEARGMQTPSTVSLAQQPTLAPAPAPPPKTQPASITSGTVQSDVVPEATMIADDADLIEKEWVMRAKAIVAHTKDDPYNQNREMTKVRADYLKKRYNKDLKVSEG